MELVNWEEAPIEWMSDTLGRQLIHTETMTLARVTLLEGGSVPMHEHENEQIVTVLEGRVRFVVDGEERVVEAGIERATARRTSRTRSRRSPTPSCSTSSRRAARTGSAATTPTCAAEVVQLTAFFTRVAIFFSSAGVSFVSAYATGHMEPSSRLALSLKPNIA